MEKYGGTHFLRIPYATTKSRPQLLASLDRLTRDPIAAAIPKEAWTHPKQPNYTLGLLRLDSPRRIKEACPLAHDITADYHDPLAVRRICKRARRGRIQLTHFSAAKDLEETVRVLRSSQSQAIALHGLHDQPSRHTYSKAAMSLQCNVKESFFFLRGFCSLIVDAFVAKGFMRALPPNSGLLQACLMKTYCIESNAPCMKPGVRARGRRYKSPVLDASDLHLKYKKYL